MTDLATRTDVNPLAAYGRPVDTADGRLPLVGRPILWLVTGGTLDLFAVGAGGRGRWHFLGRLTAGTIVASAVAGPEHILVGRPHADCALRRFDPAEVTPDRATPLSGAREEALAQGIRAGLKVVSEGTYAPRLTARAVAKALADRTLWTWLVESQTRLLHALDGRIAERDRDDDERMVAGRWAGDAAFAGAVRALRAQADADAAVDAAGAGPGHAGALPPIGLFGTRGGGLATAPTGTRRTTTRPATGPVGGDPTVAAVNLVARAAGVTVTVPDTAGTAADPVAAVAAASRIRTRSVRLADRWWRLDAGPLLGHRRDPRTPVALLWRFGRYVLVDPVSGRRTPVTAAVAETLEPTATMLYLPLPARAPGPLALLRYGLRGWRADLLRVLAGGVVAVTLGLLVPIVTGAVLGRFVPDGQRGLIVQACLAVLLASLVAMALAVVENLAVLRTEGRLAATLQAGVWDRLLRLPTAFFNRFSTGELASKAMSVIAIRQLLSGVGVVAVHAVLLAAANFALQLWYSVPLALLSAGLVLVDAAVSLALGRRQLYWHRQLIDMDNSLTNKVYQTLQGLPKLRVAAVETFAYAQWAGEFIQAQEAQRRVLRLRSAGTVFHSAFVPLATLVLFAVLVGPGGGLSVGGFLTFIVAFSVQLAAVSQFIGAVTATVAVVPLFRQLRPILEEPTEVSGADLPPGELTGEIELRGVSFRYTPEGPTVLDDVSLRVGAGEFVAIVGPTGCGKSTLLRLLIGFEKPTAGSVRYDGMDLSTLDISAVRRQCGVVLQNARPFSGTILENICGAERFPTSQVWEAARLAGLADDIKRMPMGLFTPVQEGGGTLSAGQRQRLMIAQALIRRPRILFFDEATSALDNETQRIVTESTRETRATRVVIAHRLSTVMRADRVVVLAEGRVVQSGSPASLLADRQGAFYQLAHRQVG